MEEKILRVAVVGGLGLMASPMARHWGKGGSVRVVRVHDRGTPGERRERSRKHWREHGAQLVRTLEELTLDTDLDGVFVCAGKNGDDRPIVSALARGLAHRGRFLCHLSTISTQFAQSASAFCVSQGVEYVNYPLTGGSQGAENATMLILAGGPRALYDRLEPALAQLGRPKYFGERVSAGAEVKFMGHLMVFNGLMGITSAVAMHAACFGGEPPGPFFDFLNAGAGGTRQWDLVLKPAVEKSIWHEPFLLKYAVVDAIYTAQLCHEKKISALTAEAVLRVAVAFSFAVNEWGPGLATQALVRALATERAADLDRFVAKHSPERGDIKKGIAACVASLPAEIRSSVALELSAADFGGNEGRPGS